MNCKYIFNGVSDLSNEVLWVSVDKRAAKLLAVKSQKNCASSAITAEIFKPFANVHTFCLYQFTLTSCGLQESGYRVLRQDKVLEIYTIL